MPLSTVPAGWSWTTSWYVTPSAARTSSVSRTLRRRSPLAASTGGAREPYVARQLAGGRAERRFTGLEVESGEADRQNAFWVAVEICPEGEAVQTHLDRTDDQAKVAVNAKRDAIQAVAERLIQTERVSGPDRDALTSTSSG